MPFTKEQRKEYHLKRYADPEYAAKAKATAKAHRPKYKERNKEYIDNHKRNNPCPCGESDIVCLDFHHIENKKECISNMVRKMVSLETLQAEMDKCIVLCRNCHAKLHAKSKSDGV